MVTHLLLFVKGARGEICKFSPNPLPCRKKTQRKLLTNRPETNIILWHLRECWNGRQARLRCVWLRRVGSSPISRTKLKPLRIGILGGFLIFGIPLISDILKPLYVRFIHILTIRILNSRIYFQMRGMHVLQRND